VSVSTTDAAPIYRLSYSAKLNGSLPGVAPTYLAAAPNVRFQFDWNRDPYVRLQMQDRGKSEAQRRDEASGRGSGMIEKDKAAPYFRPPENISKPVDRRNFNHRWIRELRSAVMSAAKEINKQDGRSRSRNQDFKGPSR